MQPLVDNLNAAFASGKTRSLDWRREQLSALERMLTENVDAIKRALDSDLKKCDMEAWTSEIGFLLNDIRHTQKHLGKWQKPRKVSTPLVAWPGSSYQLPEPLGTVLIIGAWNYPLQLVLAPYVAALAAGNCAVLKPSELAAATSTLLATLIPQYMDTSAVAVVEGAKDETTALLRCKWDHIFYTGGEAVGKIVMRAASEHLTPVTLELGGKSPCLVDKRTNLAVTARRIVWGKWMNAGQTCIAPDYVLVEREFMSALIDAIKAELKKQYGDNPLQSPDYGRIINARHLSRLQHYLDGVDVVAGGRVDEAGRGMEPTLVMDPPVDAAVMQEEIFGPILPIVPVASMDDAIERVRARPKPLALYLFTDDEQLQQRVLAQTSAGNVCINDTMLFMTNPELPFGGVGNSGMGSYHGQAGFDTFSHLKTVMKRSFALDVAFRYAPYTKLKQALLKKLL
ncbi:aldehyde dehydrogenase family protein [Alteromonas lipolytica]